MIKSIKLVRFKQFKETRIELKPFTILMGENNSGKTSVLQAIWLALFSLKRGKLLYPNSKGVHAKKNKSGYYMFDVPFAPNGELSGLFYNRISRRGRSNDEGSGALIEVEDDRGNRIKLQLRELFKNLHFRLLTDENELNNPDLQNYEPLYISGFVGLPFQEERVFPATLDERAVSGNVNAVVRNIILDLKLHAPHKFEFLDALLMSELGFHVQEIHFHENEELYVFSEYKETLREDSVSLEFSSCGSGVMQILQVVSVILRYCPEKTRVVLIDEPDAHLHNNLQIKFINILMQIQRELNIQIILSTHSTAIIQNADPEEVVPILSSAPLNVCLSTDEEIEKNIADRLDAYELGKAKISGKIAFFEDNYIEIYKRMADVAHIHCFSGVNTIPVICGGGKDNKLPFSLKPVLHELLGRDIEIHVIRDSDGMDENVRGELEKYANKSGVILHILSKYEIENYVLDAELIHRALIKERRNPPERIPSVEEIHDKIREALRDTIRGGIYKYSTTLTDVLYKTRRNLLGEGDYKSDDASKEADRIYAGYYDCTDFDVLHDVGMGKEARKIVFSWLSDEKKLRISKKAILQNMKEEDVCDEIRDLLEQLESLSVGTTGMEGEGKAAQKQNVSEQLSIFDE